MPRKKKSKLTKAQQRSAAMLKGLDHNYRYSIDVDYVSDRDCVRAGCDTICRCETLDNVQIEEDTIDLEYVASEFMTNKEGNADDSILKYCIERLLVLYKRYDGDNWYVSVCNGYYGQEIEGVYLELVDTKERNSFFELLDKSNVERIKYVLRKEYGYLLPKLEKLNKARVVHPKIDDVAPVQNSYPKSISGDTYNKERWLPYCVCTKEDGVYHIIDGHHRYASALEKGLKKIPVVLLY